MQSLVDGSKFMYKAITLGKGVIKKIKSQEYAYVEASFLQIW